MAKFINNMISGVVGQLIFKIIKGKQYVMPRMIPGTMKQTQNTKEASKIFALGCALGMYIMQCSAEHYNNFQDSDMFLRLTGKLRILFRMAQNKKSRLFNIKEDSFKSLLGFDYNTKSPLISTLKTAPVINFENKKLSVFVSDLDNLNQLVYPETCFNCDVTVGIALFRLKDSKALKDAEVQRISLKKNINDITSHDFKFDVPDGCLCIVSLGVNFYSHGHRTISLINNRTFNPVMIVDAFVTPGEYVKCDKRRWVKMDEFKLAHA